MNGGAGERRDPFGFVITEIRCVSEHALSELDIVEIVRDTESREASLRKCQVDECQRLFRRRRDEGLCRGNELQIFAQRLLERSRILDLEENKALYLFLLPDPFERSV